MSSLGWIIALVARLRRQNFDTIDGTFFGPRAELLLSDHAAPIAAYGDPAFRAEKSSALQSAYGFLHSI